MDFNAGIINISRPLADIPWTTWHPPHSKFLKRQALQGMADIHERYPPGAFITLMAMAGLNNYLIRASLYWPSFWRHVRKEATARTPIEMADMLKPFYGGTSISGFSFGGQYPQDAKVKRLHRFLKSSLAKKLWNMNPEQVAEDLPNLWRHLAITMDQEYEEKTIAFTPRTIGIALRILGVDEFSYEDIPIPVDRRIRKLTPKLSDWKIRSLWKIVLQEINKIEPQVTMFHLDGFLFPYEGAGDKMAWLASQDIDDALSKHIVKAFQELANVKAF